MLEYLFQEFSSKHKVSEYLWGRACLHLLCQAFFVLPSISKTFLCFCKSSQEKSWLLLKYFIKDHVTCITKWCFCLMTQAERLTYFLHNRVALTRAQDISVLGIIKNKEHYYYYLELKEVRFLISMTGMFRLLESTSPLLINSNFTHQNPNLCIKRGLTHVP